MVIFTGDQTPGLATNEVGEKLTQLTLTSLGSGSVIWASPLVPRALKTSSFMLMSTGCGPLFMSCNDRVSLVPGGIETSKKTGEVVRLRPPEAACVSVGISMIDTMLSKATLTIMRCQRILKYPMTT